MSRSEAAPLSARHAARRSQGRFFERYFYFTLALLYAFLALWGFLPKIGPRFLAPPTPLPIILSVHAALSTAFVLLLLAQTALVATRNVRWHRRLGVLASLVGGLIPLIGILTAVQMRDRHLAERLSGAAPFFVVQLYEMAAFAVCFALAVHWRRRPEFHKRMMWMASCVLLSAAFARLPNWLVPLNGSFAGVDVLILLVVVRDGGVLRRIHPVFLYGFPLLVLGQGIAMAIYLHQIAALAAAHAPGV
jgi:hypothetical protein